MRIVSLLPSATEIICVLGLRDHLVGVTHECDYPQDVRALPAVTRSRIPTGTVSRDIDRLVREQLNAEQALYTLDLEMLQVLQPDLLVTQALCNVCAVAEAEVQAAVCALPGTPRVLNLEPMTLAEVFASIQQVAAAAGIEGDGVVRVLEARVKQVTARVAGHPRLRVALLEWLDPPFSSGHWNPELVRLAGGTDGLGGEGRPSRTLTWEEVVAWQPEVAVVACCGFDVERTLADVPLLHHVPGWVDLPAVRAGRVYVVDGSAYFSRPGPRLVDSLELMAHLLHPAVVPLPHHIIAPVRLAPDLLKTQPTPP
jgi:iron complex transport system substrate-binding protein